MLVYAVFFYEALSYIIGGVVKTKRPTNGLLPITTRPAKSKKRTRTGTKIAR
jgi:hypothetical protein